jgi:hypothetical protein
MCFAVEGLLIARELIPVRYSGANAADLLSRCDAWFVSQSESTVRDQFKGSRMLVSQLDLFDKAFDRVRAVRMNCVEILAKSRAL